MKIFLSSFPSTPLITHFSITAGNTENYMKYKNKYSQEFSKSTTSDEFIKPMYQLCNVSVFGYLMKCSIGQV